MRDFDSTFISTFDFDFDPAFSPFPAALLLLLFLLEVDVDCLRFEAEDPSVFFFESVVFVYSVEVASAFLFEDADSLFFELDLGSFEADPSLWWFFRSLVGCVISVFEPEAAYLEPEFLEALFV